jgi:hypothetical protein
MGGFMWPTDAAQLLPNQTCITHLANDTGSTMKIICSWCRQEGKSELMGEKAPLKDERETHGICLVHRHEVEARWLASIHNVSHSGFTAGLSAELFRWTSLLHANEKMRC